MIMRATEFLDQSQEAALLNLLDLFVEVFSLSLTTAFVGYQERVWSKQAGAASLPWPPGGSPLCLEAIRNQDILLVPDVTCDARFQKDRSIYIQLEIGFYIGIPFCKVQGQSVGLLSLFGSQARNFEEGEMELVLRLARQFEALFENQIKNVYGEQHRQQLELSLARNQALLNRAAVGIIRITQEGIIEQANPAVERIIGYPDTELVGQNVQMLMPERWARNHDEYIASYLRGRPPSIIGIGREVNALHKCGRLIPIHLAVSEVVIPEQNSVEFIGIITDLSELHHSRQREHDQNRLLQVLHRGMTDFTALMSSDQLWSYLKDALCSLTESESALIGEVAEQADGTTGLKIHAITDLAWSPASKKMVESWLSGNAMITNPESMLGRVFSGGEEVIFDSNDQSPPGENYYPEGHPAIRNYLGVPIRDQDKIIGMYAIANSKRQVNNELLTWLEPFTATCALLINLYRRISEQANFTKELEIAHAQQAQASKAKTDFLSSMSHELRTPLNSIIGFSQLMLRNQKYPMAERQLRQIEQIFKSGQHLLGLINDILDLARIEAGKLPLSIEPISIPLAVKEAIETMGALADGKGISIIFSASSAYSPYVLADFMRVKQVLINLISNAIKYNREGGIIKIGWEVSPSVVKVEVKDNGVGIPLDRMTELFQPFSRLGAEHSEVEGAGVGLALTKQLLEQMNGRISVSSTEGDGSSFCFELPLTTAPQPLAAGKPARAAMDVHEIQHKHVLYIEDNPANQRLMQDILEESNACKLTCAHNAQLGIQLAKTYKPDLIIMDINLPGIDGFSALTALRHDPTCRMIPVIGLSANAMPNDIARGLRAGFDEYLTKPLDISRLYSVLQRYLDGAIIK